MSGRRSPWTPSGGWCICPSAPRNNDFYGGHRLGDNLFAESIVCLDANTGRRVWHFQTVRHGIWDYDLPAPPNLITIQVDGETIDAVAGGGEDRIRLRLRSGHRRAGLADRRTSGAGKRRARREGPP